MKFYVRIRSTDGNIPDCLLLNGAFIISDVTQSVSCEKPLKKTTFSGFFVIFSRKLVQISIFKVEYLGNGLADFNDLVSVCRILNGLSDEINLF